MPDRFVLEDDQATAPALGSRFVLEDHPPASPSRPSRPSVQGLGAPAGFGEHLYLRSPGAIVDAIGAAEGVPSYGVETLAAKYGGDHSKVPWTEGRAAAAQIVHREYKNWTTRGKPGDFLDHLADVYAPMGVANDPMNLNANWMRNVVSALSRGETAAPSRQAPHVARGGVFDLSDPRYRTMMDFEGPLPMSAYNDLAAYGQYRTEQSRLRAMTPAEEAQMRARPPLRTEQQIRAALPARWVPGWTPQQRKIAESYLSPETAGQVGVTTSRTPPRPLWSDLDIAQQVLGQVGLIGGEIVFGGGAGGLGYFAGFAPEVLGRLTGQSARALAQRVGRAVLPQLERLVPALASETGSVSLPTGSGRWITQRAGEVWQTLQDMRQELVADKTTARQFIDEWSRRLPLVDRVATHHFGEDLSRPATDAQRAFYAELRPRLEENAKLFGSLKQRGYDLRLDVAGHMPRYSIGYRNPYEVIEAAGRGLSGRQQALQDRVMYAAVDAAGHRTVVSIEGNRVTGWVRNVAHDLGELRLVAEGRLLEQELRPIDKQITTVERDLRTLGRGQRVSGAMAKRLEALGLKVDDLQNLDLGAHQRLADLQGTLANIRGQLASALAEGTPDLVRDLRAEQRTLLRSIQTLQAATADSARIGRRLGTIRQMAERIPEKSAPLTRAITALEAKREALEQARFRAQAGHIVNDLDQKVFIAKGGTRYRIVDATTAEITAHSPVRYYEDPLVNVVAKNLELRHAKRVDDFLESLKRDPEFRAMATDGHSPAMAHWVPTRLPKFPGWRMEPKLAAVFDQLAGRNAILNINLAKAVNQQVLWLIFSNPFAHWPNLFWNWMVAGGTFQRLLRPRVFVETMGRAIKDLGTQSPALMDLIRSGMPSRFVETQNEARFSDLVRRAGVEAQDPGIAQKLAMPVTELWRIIRNVSNYATWFADDLLRIQAIYQLESFGLARQEAIREINRVIPDYITPAFVDIERVLGRGPLQEKTGIALGRVLNDRTLFIFNAYHTTLLRSLRNVTLTPGRTSGERARGVDRLLTLGLAWTLLIPQSSRWVRSVLVERAKRRLGAAKTDEQRASALEELERSERAGLRPAGMMMPIEAARNVWHGESPIVAAGRLLTPAPAASLLSEYASGRDPRTGMSIRFGSPWEVAQKLGGAAIRLSRPAEIIAEAAQGKDVVLPTLRLAGIRLPKLLPEEARLLMDGHAMVREVNASINRLLATHAPADERDATRRYWETRDRLHQLAVQHARAQRAYGVPDAPQDPEAYAQQYVDRFGPVWPSGRALTRRERQHEVPPGAIPPGRLPKPMRTRPPENRPDLPQARGAERFVVEPPPSPRFVLESP